MSNRPWVTPDEVKAYSDKPGVQARNDNKLEIDIARAEQYVISYTRNKFESEDVPEAVKTAVVLIAEMYADSAISEQRGSYKSETFDDYSYTAADTASKLENLDLGPLLDEFVVQQPRNSVTMRIRKL